MSRYVKKKHGLIIGSDNVWSFKDADGKVQSGFRAIVYCQNFDFADITMANVHVRTPAQQLIWDEWEIERETGVVDFPDVFTVCEPMWSVRAWLDANAPGWGCEPPIERNPHPSLFFTRRKHAVAFVRWVEEKLRGVDKFRD